ncbi:ethanolamine ammonia-lyase reactivating factor EutA [Sporolactobacillus sp. THM19-2]|uniref:ethanolamine ammonia-lyase reactivating factor EutA n=1 Tax=Sporolactobacillus sp. THM19-2 TaxID=2511171 RepID=UPI00101ECFEE|nr:ethanolamine ammonia-lyase reactivating factor EutA [Sporolactobacillus sp. THM19-2]RYL88129.1 ethanolamine utilization protein [Sporolactobacillus sp. THM19-2]
MKSKIISVGIDIGTTTTQVIFSEFTIQNTASDFHLPKVKITEKNIIYKSAIYFTPLISREKIDLSGLKGLISQEYKRAGIRKDNISTGAIIITGETARKENAEKVLNALSDFAGDFVVATAGADLEAILAGFGSGAAEMSKNHSKKVVNLDIGGGTTNTSVFFEGEIVDSYALDIGGRLIRFNKENKIIYISDKIKTIIDSLKLNLHIGARPSFEDLNKLTDKFAQIILKVANNKELSDEEKDLFIQHRNKDVRTEITMFSGGVSEFIYHNAEINTLEDTTKFGDIGPLLGYSIRKVLEKDRKIFLEPKEKIRATVMGAGIHSIKLSGSTIIFDEEILPIKNIPILKVFSNDDRDLVYLYKNICSKMDLYPDEYVAVAFKGPKAPKYLQIKKMAESIVKAFEYRNHPIIVVIENDFAKALGQTIKNIVRDSRKVISIDNIEVDTGDYIDIGKPIANTVPVVIKTLIFKN